MRLPTTIHHSRIVFFPVFFLYVFKFVNSFSRSKKHSSRDLQHIYMFNSRTWSKVVSEFFTHETVLYLTSSGGILSFLYLFTCLVSSVPDRMNSSIVHRYLLLSNILFLSLESACILYALFYLNIVLFIDSFNKCFCLCIVCGKFVHSFR